MGERELGVCGGGKGSGGSKGTTLEGTLRHLPCRPWNEKLRNETLIDFFTDYEKGVEFEGVYDGIRFGKGEQKRVWERFEGKVIWLGFLCGVELGNFSEMYSPISLCFSFSLSKLAIEKWAFVG